MYTQKQLALIISRDLRKRQTSAEQVFWEKVKNKQFLGYKFLRQHPIFYEYYDKEKFFIADFYCRDLKLVVEIDGGVHEEQKDYDKIRTEILEAQHDLNVIRYENEEVTQGIIKVLMNLKSVVNSINKK
jgi:very-short-patch-repair endonuclease